jgi:hypothetical protein
MRAGPGHNFGTLDEIAGGEKIAVLSCADRWCAIRYGRGFGYVEQDALALPTLPRGGSPMGAAHGCFEASGAAWLRPARQEFCPLK